MRIEVHKGSGTRYRSTLYRPDGIVVALEGGSWNRIGGPIGRVPHDLAHFVVEQELGLARGLWGVLAAGGLVQNAEYVGRRPQHAAARAKKVTDAAREDLGQAEAVVRAMADATLGNGGRGPVTVSPEVVDRIGAELRATALEWDRLAPGTSLVREWRAV